jgi:YegS/Rv2252/BmrU family lipid kinase
VINARSRKGSDDVTAALEVLRGSGMEALALRLTSPVEVEAAIREHRSLVDLVALGGGDGTMNAAAEALVASGLPLGVLPLGTANDLARSLGVPPNPVEAARIIVAGKSRRIDLGRANDKLFFNIATMGLSARLARAMDRQTKRRFGALAYAITLARIGVGHPFRATIRAGGQTVEVKAIQIAVGNGRFHGGGIVVHEEAAIDDGLLHLYALEPHSPWQLVRKLPWLLRGKHAAIAGVTTLAASEMEVLTDRTLPVNTDGELTTHTPVHFTVVPQALEVFTPD